MKKLRTKILATAGCVLAALCLTIQPTLAWLSSLTDPVINTFSSGYVSISMDETAVNSEGRALKNEPRTLENTYKYVPGAVVDKDPTVTVKAGSEPCYIFACVENGAPEYFSMDINSSWRKIAEESGTTIYEYDGIVDASVSSDPVTLEPVFQHVTISDQLTSEVAQALGDRYVVVTAYAIQSDHISEQDAAQEAIKQLDPNAVLTTTLSTEKNEDEESAEEESAEEEQEAAKEEEASAATTEEKTETEEKAETTKSEESTDTSKTETTEEKSDAASVKSTDEESPAAESHSGGIKNSDE